MKYMEDSWKRIIEDRYKAKCDLHKDIDKIRKKIKKIGTSDSLQYIAKQIEIRYGLPCRVRECGHRFRRLILYKSSATKKQVQYDREELHLGSILTIDSKIAIYNDKSEDWDTVEFPDSISKIFELLKDKNQEKWTVNMFDRQI